MEKDGTQHLLMVLTEQRNTACDQWATASAAARTLETECQRLSTELAEAHAKIAVLEAKGTNGSRSEQSVQGSDGPVELPSSNEPGH